MNPMTGICARSRGSYSPLCLAGILVLAGLGPATRASAAVAVPTNFTNEVIKSGLDQPLSLAFIPDGRLLFLEQVTGKVRMIVGGAIATTDPIFTVTGLNTSGGERGLQGVAVDPGWPARPYIYFYYNRTGGFLRLVRYTASGDVNSSYGQQLLLGTPLILIDDFPDANDTHNGGTLRFGPDGFLYLSIGEDTDACAAQDSTRLKGALLKIDVSRLPTTGGGPVARSLITPTSYALVTSNDNAKLVYAYGLRNPWRFQIDPATGIVYLGDVGDNTYEELDEILPGKNMGWPFREGLHNHTNGSCSEPAGTGRYTAPIHELNHSTGSRAILSAGVYRSQTGAYSWPTSYLGKLFFSDYAAGYLRRMEKNGSTWITSPSVPGQPNSQDWATGMTSPVDFAVGPDGSLWWLSQYNATKTARTGSLNRIRYTGAMVDAPEAAPLARAFRAAPNPFINATDLSFSLAAPARASVQIYDTRGRHIRTMFEGQAQAGETRLTWDGADDRGRTVATGIYFVRLEHAGRHEALRLVRWN